MKIINDKDKGAIEERLRELDKPIRLAFFTQELECQFCKETHWLLEDLASLSSKITLDVHNFQIDKEKARSFQIDKIPAIAILGDGSKDHGIRFYGIPSGYEFATLLDGMIAVSTENSGLSPATRDRLKEVKTPLHLQIFVTPT
ncbi:MAG: hypothetical protein AB1756_02110 [Acidobacteriota bacterium]